MRARLFNFPSLNVGAFASVAQVGASGITLTYRGNYNTETDSATYTSAASDFGPASSDRIIVVGIGISGSAGGVITGVTIGGVTATAAMTMTASSTRPAEIWFAAVPTGTSGDIVVTHTVTSNMRCGIDWWSISGTTQTTYSARSATNTETATATTITSTSLTVPTDGGAIAFAIHATSSGGTTTWSQTSGTGTKHSDTLIGATGLWMSSYSSTESGSQAFTASHGAASSSIRIAVIAWGP